MNPPEKFKVIPVAAQYADDAEPFPGEDTVLATTLQLPGFWMCHEPNEMCWCEPEPIPVYDRDGEHIGYFLHHRGRH